jgi:hypothetical protein
MSRDGYLPPDVEYGDIPGMFDPDDPECDCGHSQSDHEDSLGPCTVSEDGELLCSCDGFHPPNAY